MEASENGTDYHYTHDTEGRVLSKRAWGKTLYENHYDAEGYRDSITEKDKVTNFVYQGGMLLHELDEEKNPARHYVLGNEYIGLDNNYYLTDEQGSVRYVLDAAGNVQNDYRYDAFGQRIAGQENIPNRLRYNAQIEDDLTGLYYLRARYYNTGIGRFTQEDVIYNDGLNLYAYCSSNPVMYADPSGYAGGSVKQKTCGSKETSYGKSSSNCTELVPYYPANNGAVPGTEKKIYLMAGDKIDRFGGKKGKFFSPTGTPMEMRALPYDADLSQYRQFEVVKPFEVEASTIAPVFGNIGLGTQYRSSVSVDVLLKKGIIKQVGGN